MAARPPLFRPFLAAVRPSPEAQARAETARPPVPSEPAPRIGPAEAQRFRETVLPHLDAAYNLARMLARDPAAAEDIVQDAFVRALRGFHGHDGAQPRAWLLAIVRNCFFDWARAGRARAAVLAEVPAEEEDQIARLADTTTDDPETALLRRSQAGALRLMIEQLPAPFREALVLREFEDLSYREIGEATGVPIGTVMSRLARARRILAEGLALSGEEACG